MRKCKNLIGKRFGSLLVVEKTKDSNGKTSWVCECDCGNKVIISNSYLQSGNKTHCGCKRKGNITGQRFGRLVALEMVGNDKYGIKLWKCKCDCGNEKIVTYTHLKRGMIKSCGCLHATQNYVHGLNGSRLQGIYYKMLYRCNNPKCENYADYGGRGIKICDEWLGDNGFKNFYEWAFSNRYTEKLTLDRKDNDKGYSPDNCRWVDAFVQENNRRNNIFIEYKGERLTIGEWSRKTGINYNTLFHRYQKGWSPSKMLEVKKK